MRRLDQPGRLEREIRAARRWTQNLCGPRSSAAGGGDQGPALPVPRVRPPPLVVRRPPRRALGLRWLDRPFKLNLLCPPHHRAFNQKEFPPNEAVSSPGNVPPTPTLLPVTAGDGGARGAAPCGTERRSRR